MQIMTTDIDPIEQIREVIAGDNMATEEEVLDVNPDIIDAVFDGTLPGDDDTTK